MTTTEFTYPYRKHLIVAAVIGMLGLLTGLAYMLRSTPYTMLIFLMGGQVLIFLAIGIYIYVMARDIKAKLDSIVEKPFAKGEVIFRQGDDGDRLYVVTKGEVEVVREDPEKGDLVLARLGPGEYFGEMALINNQPRNATVRAVTDAETLNIHRTDFDLLFRNVPALRQSIEAVMKQRSLKIKERAL